MFEHPTKQSSSVQAFTCKVDLLIRGKLHNTRGEKSLSYPLEIDRYQRPYVWNEKKVHQLLEDLKHHDVTKGAYYLGSILLHERNGNDDNKQGLFVIDGQQRLTTLLLLYRILFKQRVDSEQMALHYYHQESYQNIQSAYYLIEEYLSSSGTKQSVSNSLDGLEVTIIKTDDIDLAFTFFDSQNSRGIRLNSTDILKSYHLREIKHLGKGDTENRRYLERNSARRWEHLQTFKGILNTEHDFAFELFHKLIWRARRWRGKQVDKDTRDTVIEEFQDGTVKDTTGNIPLYPNRQNMLSEYLIESKEEGLKRSGGFIRVTNKSSHLPFTLRQPIHSGLHYFLFAEKYAELVYELYREDTADQQVRKFREYVDIIVENNSYYLKELFLVCSVSYYDKYGSENLFEFAELLGLDHGIKRMEQYYIFRKSALKYMREYNLIDVISNSFRTEQVLASLKNHILPSTEERLTTHVDLTDVDRDGVLDQGGVNERCYNAFYEFYRIRWEPLTGKNGDELDLTKFAKEIIDRRKSAEDE